MLEKFKKHFIFLIGGKRGRLRGQACALQNNSNKYRAILLARDTLRRQSFSCQRPSFFLLQQVKLKAFMRFIFLRTQFA